MENLTQKTTQTTENQVVKPTPYEQMLMDTPACKGLELVEPSSLNSGIQVIKEKISFVDRDVLIVRAQWTKTQGGFGIRVNNFYSEKRHFLQISMNNLKQCQSVVDQLKKTGQVQLWTGHVINVNNSNFK
tara:strand:- start:76 stop:465 length:390 start_codon:yes stop_codon:yes gene_type:complete